MRREGRARREEECDDADRAAERKGAKVRRERALVVLSPVMLPNSTPACLPHE